MVVVVEEGKGKELLGAIWAVVVAAAAVVWTEAGLDARRWKAACKGGRLGERPVNIMQGAGGALVRRLAWGAWRAGALCPPLLALHQTRCPVPAGGRMHNKEGARWRVGIQ